MATMEDDKPKTGYLPWEEDLELVSRYLDRKVHTHTVHAWKVKAVEFFYFFLQSDLEEIHKRYLVLNPELKALLGDFVLALLIQKPSDVYGFARDFFNPFDPSKPTPKFYPCQQ